MARTTRSHWKAGQLRDAAPHTSLVLRQMITVSNYDYITDYIFYLTGIFEANISFTGKLEDVHLSVQILLNFFIIVFMNYFVIIIIMLFITVVPAPAVCFIKQGNYMQE